MAQRNSAVLDPEVNVHHGANTTRVALKPGTVVATLRVNLTESLGIPAGVKALVDGKAMSDHAVIPGTATTVEFLRRTGELG